jgi:hypothetical protein
MHQFRVPGRARGITAARRTVRQFMIRSLRFTHLVRSSQRIVGHPGRDPIVIDAWRATTHSLNSYKRTMIPGADTLHRAGEILQEIEKLQGELASLFNGAGRSTITPKRRGRPPGRGKRRRRSMSPEARKKIAAAQRARWARHHATRKK